MSSSLTISRKNEEDGDYFRLCTACSSRRDLLGEETHKGRKKN